ncbi:MAG TPA: hypothetical protein VN634_21100 [Candidatus Limnocylindrales bacterium]|nr:hypothetical protein [Candidatus Limnocylindrales bacterium]
MDEMQHEPSVHDNHVYAYVVDCEARRLVLHTAFRDKMPHEFTDVVFREVCAHFFEHVLKGNILFDVEEVSLERLLRENAVLFEDSWHFAWPPIEYAGNLVTLVAKLTSGGTKAFSITSSYGLSGWVLAAGCERVVRESAVKPE